MASASLFVFCVPDELIGWVRTLCAEKNLGCITFRDSARTGIVVDDPDDLAARDDTYRMFLYPSATPPTSSLTMNDVRAREWGWVDVRPGRLIRTKPEDILTLSEIHGEDFEYEPVHPAKYVRWLKRRIKNGITSGVTGRNVVSGGESTYRDLSYSSGAERLYRSGVVWKQFPDGNAVFEPVGSASSRPRGTQTAR